jgi:hypothetical protein
MLRKKPSEIHLKALIKLFFKYSPMLITWMGEFVADNLQSLNFFENDLGLAAAINDDKIIVQ